MSEIEKLYENAGLLYCNKCRHDSELDCFYMCESKYPPFAAEKQIELIKWLIANAHCSFIFSIKPSEFTEYLAKNVNYIWQGLKEQEKAEIKRILE